MVAASCELVSGCLHCGTLPGHCSLTPGEHSVLVSPGSVGTFILIVVSNRIILTCYKPLVLSFYLL